MKIVFNNLYLASIEKYLNYKNKNKIKALLTKLLDVKNIL